MKKTAVEKFVAACAKAVKEEQVIDAYQHLLGVEGWPRPFGSDGLYEGTLFEFKTDVQLAGTGGYKALAQACYYLRRALHESVSNDAVFAAPIRVACGDLNQAFVVTADKLEAFAKSADFDWSLQPSSPDQQLVDKLRETIPLNVYNTTTPEGIQSFLNDVMMQGTQLLGEINADNFTAVFRSWKQALLPDLTDPQLAAFIFLKDLEKEIRINLQNNTLEYVDVDRRLQTLQAPISTYETFWRVFKRPPTQQAMRAIVERKDQLVAIQARRVTGEFNTPLDIAELAHKYVLQANPEAYEHYWWDCCAGTGNLTFHCPRMPERLFISTLNQGDIKLIEDSGQNPEALKFVYDFLNQPETDFPTALEKALQPGSKWIFLINPPFAAGTGGAVAITGVRSGMSDTVIQKQMEQLELGHACQNLYSQFLFRITELVEQHKLQATLGVFSVAAWLRGTGFAPFRKYWQARWSAQGCLLFNSAEFDEASGTWPCSFTLWSSK